MDMQMGRRKMSKFGWKGQNNFFYLVSETEFKIFKLIRKYLTTSQHSIIGIV